MLIHFVREEGISLEQHRGVETIDANILFLLVRSSVEQVAQVFSALKQMNVWVRNAYDREIDIQNESIFIFQLRGHPWSLIYKPHIFSRRIYLTEEDACSVSELLNTWAIYYAGSDTCGTLEYHLYSNGTESCGYLRISRTIRMGSDNAPTRRNYSGRHSRR